MTTVNNFVDILRIIREQPEWGEALRSALLSKEVLELPQRLAEFSEAANRRFDRLEGDVAVLKDDVSVLKTDVAELKEDVSVLKTDMAEVKGDVAALKEGQARLEGEVSQLRGDVGNIKGTGYELKVAANIATHVRHPMSIRRARVLKAIGVSDNSAFYDTIDSAEDRGVITVRERTEAGQTDIVLRGQKDSDRSILFVAVEASVTAGDSDVTRAAERAEILSRATGENTLAAVVCAYVDDERVRLAEELDVTLIFVPE